MSVSALSFIASFSFLVMSWSEHFFPKEKDPGKNKCVLFGMTSLFLLGVSLFIQQTATSFDVSIVMDRLKHLADSIHKCS